MRGSSERRKANPTYRPAYAHRYHTYVHTIPYHTIPYHTIPYLTIPTYLIQSPYSTYEAQVSSCPPRLRSWARAPSAAFSCGASEPRLAFGVRRELGEPTVDAALLKLPSFPVQGDGLRARLLQTHDLDTFFRIPSHLHVGLGHSPWRGGPAPLHRKPR